MQETRVRSLGWEDPLEKEMTTHSSILAKMLLEISGEITPERMNGCSQSKNNTQLWMGLGIDARSNAVKSNIA